MSQMIHFKKWSLARGHIRINLNLERYGERFEYAQRWLGDRVLEDCKPVMPHDTGSLQQRSRVEDGGRRVIFPGPYGRYLYMGRVMVEKGKGRGPIPFRDSPGSVPQFRFHTGAKLMATNRRLTYSRPGAVDHWFDEAKARNLTYWVNSVENIIKTGRP